MEADLNQSRPSEEANPQVPAPSPSPAESSAPGGGAELRLNQLVLDALSKVPGGKQLDDFFGISSGVPQQPSAEAAEGERLIKGLKAVSEGGLDLSSLLGPIAKHTEEAELDPDLLRSLMQPRKKAGQ
jgi:hypothetical protein